MMLRLAFLFMLEVSVFLITEPLNFKVIATVGQVYVYHYYYYCWLDATGFTANVPHCFLDKHRAFYSH